MKMSEESLLKAFGEFQDALHAAGAGTDGLFVQTRTDRDPFGQGRTFYRVGRRGMDDDATIYPLGEGDYHAATLASMLQVATLALRLVSRGGRVES